MPLLIDGYNLIYAVGMGGKGNVAGAGSMGGTGNVAGAGSMGGTGTVADAYPIVPNSAVASGASGAGGTGGMGGTGIVGTITGFASICVNGVEVHYDANTPVSINGRAGTARELAVGQQVALNARTVAGQLHANGIGVVDAITGPVTQVSPATRTLQIMGQTVRADAVTGINPATLNVGDVARVSGHRAPNGDIIATRVDRASPSASVLGTVTAVEANAISVNGTRVVLSAARL